MTLRLTALSGLSLMLATTAASAADLQIYHQDGLQGGLALTFPLSVRDNSATIARLSYARDDNSQSAFSLEAMRRTNLANGWMIGTGIFADSSADDMGNRFGQVGLSAELQHGVFQARLNAYVPVGTKNRSDSRFDSLAEMDGTIRFRSGRSLALKGADMELGGRIQFASLGGGSFGLFGGGFSFEHSDGASYSGATARAEVALDNLFGTRSGARFRAGLRADRSSGSTDTSAYAALTIPFGSNAGSSNATSAGGFGTNRLTRDVERRRRVTTRSGAFGAVEAVSLAGQALGRFARIDAGGNLQEALVDTGENGLVFTSGDFTTSGLVLSEGQTLVGGGGSVVLQAESGRQMRMANRGAPTTLQESSAMALAGSGAAFALLTMADDSRAQSLTLSGGDQGITASNVDGFHIADVAISGSRGDAVHLSNVSDASFTDLSIANVGGNGFSATGGTQIAVTGAQITAPGENGFLLRSVGNFSLRQARLSDMPTCEDNTLCEFSVYNPSSVPNSGINAIGLTDSRFDGIRMDDVTYGFFLASDISTESGDYTVVAASTGLELNDITITNSRREAILAVGVDGLNMTNVVLDNSQQGSDMDLVVMQSSGQVSMDGAVLTGGINGLMFVDALRLDGITEDMSFRNIVINDTSRAGVFLNPVQNIDFENIEINNAGTHGIFMLGDSWGFNGGAIRDVTFADTTINAATTAGVNFYGPVTNVTGEITVANSPAGCSADTSSWSGTSITNDAGSDLSINGRVMTNSTLGDCAAPY
ncbi:hypothetical protein R1T40_19465 [Tritonibacter scottomollicae]|uniref:Right handed beta helix domain-containing protein n=1 Tax=Tritonibacter scottomollicae TaxID=483013 RepID=A0ABZ0HE16_TRISK|nr:hypothetical protein [Tritonibacter scottomollicae]WOI33085.1 hypothetical protein R1T40_19465 [Tritonibacter scottomollicae]